MAQGSSPSNVDDMNQLELVKQKSIKVCQLIREFDDFYERWMERLKEVTGDDTEWGSLGQTGSKEKNGQFLMVTYNGNNNY